MVLMANHTSEALQGWTSSPNGRGSFDVLWTCVATIFLSTWSAICMNVPDPSESRWDIIKRKAWITSISIMGSEFLLAYSLGEWRSASISVARFKQLRHDDKWTLKHAFFADMGGFVLRTSDNVCCFLDTNHIYWLLEHKAISQTQFEKRFLLDERDINDRNKSDIFVRVIAVGQAVWFCVNVIARGVQGLPVTTLEINTVAIVSNSILVYYIWRKKPASVESAEIINIGMTLGEIISLEEDEEARTRSTATKPFAFIDRESWSLNLMYHYLRNLLKHLNPGPRRGSEEVFVGRRSENDVFPIRGASLAIGVLATAVFVGINFIAWDFSFPTATEKFIWRLCCCGIVILSVLSGLIFQIFLNQRAIDQIQEKVRAQRKEFEQSDVPDEKAPWKERLIYRFRALAVYFKNNSFDKDPKLDVSFGIVLLVPAFILYTALRAYLLIEDVIAFRALPAGVFESVNWWAFVPHFG